MDVKQPVYPASKFRKKFDQEKISNREGVLYKIPFYYKPTLVRLKDIRAQNVPKYRYLLNLPRRKVMIYVFQKCKKNGGSPFSFSRS